MALFICDDCHFGGATMFEALNLTFVSSWTRWCRGAEVVAAAGTEGA